MHPDIHCCNIDSCSYGPQERAGLGQTYFELRFLQSGADYALCSLVEWVVSRSQYKVWGKPSQCNAAKGAFTVSPNRCC